MYNLLKTRKPTRRHGYIFPMILMATLSVGVFIVTISQMQSMNRAKFKHLNDYQRAFNIAYSALVEVLADIQTRQWSNRSFKDSSVAYTRDLFGGRFNLLVEDHDADEFLYNTKIRVQYEQKSYLFYWRLQYVPDLLDFARFTIPVYFGEFKGETGTMDDFISIDSIVDAELARKRANLPGALETARIIGQQNTIDDSLNVIGIPGASVLNGLTPRPEREELIVNTGDIPSDGLIRLMQAVKPGQELAMRPLHFDIEATTVSASSLPYLEALASYLADNPDLRVRVVGHTDNVGGADYNLVLSRERSGTVVSFLQARGVGAGRMSSTGFGEAMPIASNATEHGRLLNRRVEVYIQED